MKKIIEGFAFFVAVFLFLYTSFMLVNRLKETACQEELMNSILETVYQEIPDPSETRLDKQAETDIIPEQVLFDETRTIRNKNLYRLYGENNDLAGWVQIEGTVIDYPFMQTFIEPDFYLTHGFDKKKSSFGSIYMDSRCIPGHVKNYVLYGHHMKNGSMFASLQNYTHIDYCLAHPVIQFDSLSTISDYEVVGAFSIPSSDIETMQDILLFDSQEHFDSFSEYFESHKFYDTGKEYSFDDEFLTLMTCEYSHKNGRFFVIAKRVKTMEV